jgi:flagellin
MPQVINTNVMSLNSQRALNMSQKNMATSLERLSSGLRVNRAADDAAGLAIAERFTSQIRGLSQAVRNANDGVSMVQTGEGALGELTNAMQRMRELAVQSANGIYNINDRNKLDLEFQQLSKEVERIIQATEFNETAILKGDTITFKVGFQSGSTNQITISTSNLSAATEIIALLSAATKITGSNAAFALSALGILDNAIELITEERAKYGAAQNRLESTIRNLENVVENQSAARSRIMDADFAKETAELTRTQILQQAGTAMLSQANQLPSNVLSLLG